MADLAWLDAELAQEQARRSAAAGVGGLPDAGEPGFWGDVRLSGKVIGQGLYSAVADVLPKTVAEAVRGGDVPLRPEETFAGRAITGQQKDLERWNLPPQEAERELFGVIKARDVQEGLQNLGYSAGSMVAGGLAGGLAGSVVPGAGNVAGALAGMAGAGLASGAVGYRATKDQFVDDMRRRLLEADPAMSEERWQEAKKAIESDASLYGLWEAVPEAVGSALTWGILKTPVGKLVESVPFIRNGAARAAATAGVKLGLDLPVELGTEAWTQHEQGAIEARQGLREAAPTWGEAFGEIAPQTTVATLATMGLGGAAEHFSPGARRARRESRVIGEAAQPEAIGQLSDEDLQAAMLRAGALFQERPSLELRDALAALENEASRRGEQTPAGPESMPQAEESAAAAPSGPDRAAVLTALAKSRLNDLAVGLGIAKPDRIKRKALVAAVLQAEEAARAWNEPDAVEARYREAHAAAFPGRQDDFLAGAAPVAEVSQPLPQDTSTAGQALGGPDRTAALTALAKSELNTLAAGLGIDKPDRIKSDALVAAIVTAEDAARGWNEPDAVERRYQESHAAPFPGRLDSFLEDAGPVPPGAPALSSLTDGRQKASARPDAATAAPAALPTGEIPLAEVGEKATTAVVGQLRNDIGQVGHVAGYLAAAAGQPQAPRQEAAAQPTGEIPLVEIGEQASAGIVGQVQNVAGYLAVAAGQPKTASPEAQTPGLGGQGNAARPANPAAISVAPGTPHAKKPVEPPGVPEDSGQPAQVETAKVLSGDREVALPVVVHDGFKVANVMGAGMPPHYAVLTPLAGSDVHQISLAAGKTPDEAVAAARRPPEPPHPMNARTRGQALQALSREQQNALGKALGLKPGRKSRLGFLEAIADTQEPQLRSAYDAVVGGAAKTPTAVPKEVPASGAASQGVQAPAAAPAGEAGTVAGQAPVTGQGQEVAAASQPGAIPQTAAPDTGETLGLTLGEKIGGSRKDTATPTGPRVRLPGNDETVPAWRKRFVAVQVSETGFRSGEDKTYWSIADQKGTLRTGRFKFDSKEEAEAAIPLAAVSLKHRVGRRGEAWEIYRKVTDRKTVVIKDGFASEEDAKRYMAEHAEDILNTRTGFGEEILARPEKVFRKGALRRKGPAKGQDFLDTFGFRGVEFGDWNDQAERQEVLNHAYDGLLDLAEILNVPPRALSLNGDLALAFGARGRGLSSAKAHYERDYGVINLTKMTGAGSLAHEWFHALDHYLARQDTKASSEKVENKRGDQVFAASSSTGQDFLSHGASRKSQVREALRAAYEKLLADIAYKAEQYREDTEKAERFVSRARGTLERNLNDIRAGLAQEAQWGRKRAPATAEQLTRFDVLAEQLLRGDNLALEMRSNEAQGRQRSRFGSYRSSNDILDGLAAIYKEVRGRSGFNAERTGPFNSLAANVQDFARRAKMLEDARSQTEKTKQIPTEYRRAAYLMDQGRTSDYWSEPHELAARAFAAYVEDKAAQGGGRSDFLVYGANNAMLEFRLLNIRPYPEGAERKAINAAFDHFFATVKTKETGRGVAMFQRSDTVADRKPAAADPLVEQARGEAAIEKLLEDKTGEMVGMARPDLGDIVFIYGEPGKLNAKGRLVGGEGLAHLVEQRNLEGADGVSVARRMPAVIAHGQIVARQGEGTTGERVRIAYAGHTAVLSLYRHGNRQVWLLTGWENEDGGARVNLAAAYAPTGSGISRQEGASEANIISVEPEDKGQSLFSRSPFPAGTVAQAVAAELRQGLSQFPALQGIVDVYPSEADMPSDLREAVEEAGLSGRFHGVYDAETKRIALVAGNIPTVKAGQTAFVQTLLRHEGRHAGLDRVLGGSQEREEYMRKAAQAMPREVSHWLTRQGLDSTRETRAEAAEEILVAWAKDGTVHRALDRLLSKIAVWVRSIFPTLELTRAELRQLLAQADDFVDGKGLDFIAPLGQPLAAAPAFSRGDGASWAQQVDDFLGNRFLPHERLDLGGTPPVIGLLGGHDLPLQMTQAKANKILKGADAGGKHGVSPEVLQQLPQALERPVLVLKSATWTDSLVVVTELPHQDSFLVAAVHLNVREGRAEINEVASVYAKDAGPSWVARQIREGLLLYRDKTKVPGWQRSFGLQLPTEMPTRDKRKIFTEVDLVKYEQGLPPAGDAPRFSRAGDLAGAPSEKRELAPWLKDEATTTIRSFLPSVRELTRETGVLGKILRSPEYWQHPVLRRLYDIFRSRTDRAHEILHDAFDLGDGKTIASEARRILKDPQQRDILNEGVDYADVNEIGPEAMETWFADHGAKAETIGLWRAMRAAYDRLLDARLAAYRRLVDKARAGYARAVTRRLIEAGIPVEAARAFDAAAYNADRILADALAPYADKVKAVVAAARKDGVTIKGRLADVRLTDENGTTFSFAEMVERMGQLRGFYAPRLREAGDFVVRGRRTGTDGSEERFRAHKEWRRSAEKLRLEMARAGWAMDTVTRLEKLPEATQGVIKTLELAKTVETAVNQVGEDVEAGLVGEILEALADEVKARGFRSQSIRRSGRHGEVVQGYFKDAVERFSRYAGSTAYGLAKAEAAQKAATALFATDGQGLDIRKEGEVYRLAVDYLAENLRNAEAGDRVFALAKSMASLKYLGFNAKSALVNLTSMATSVPAALHAYAMAGKGGWARIGREIVRAMGDYLGLMAGRSGRLTAGERAFMAQARRESLDDPQFAREALSVYRDTAGQAWTWAMGKALLLFGATERLNRGATLLAGYRLARAAGTDHATAIARARETSDRAHGVYDRASQPSWAWGTKLGARLGQGWYIYKKYGHNYLQLIHELFGKKDHAAGVFALAAPAALAGLGGHVAMALAKGLLTAVGGDEDPEKWLYAVISRNLGGGAEDLARFGLLGLLAGADLSGSMTMIDAPDSWVDVLGPVGGLGKDLLQAMGYLAGGQPGRAAEKALPSGAAKILQGIREYRQGVTTGSNYPVLEEGGKPLRPTLGEAAAKAAGFRPLREARARAKASEAIAEESGYAAKRDALYARFRAFALDGGTDADERDALLAAINTFNADAAVLGGRVAPITRESLLRQADRLERPTKRERARLGGQAGPMAAETLDVGDFEDVGHPYQAVRRAYAEAKARQDALREAGDFQGAARLRHETRLPRLRLLVGQVQAVRADMAELRTSQLPPEDKATRLLMLRGREKRAMDRAAEAYKTLFGAREP
ncbi:PLxRFG domain-containing protein [Solidesulfovibrio magneticus]|uniref:Large polyvalent protein-associated domain-containing protein n=1 Tax=Solidesulfovibrio magneticus (strain ATCC 700980 / DSM 13731 / RS-1) TaxID=573370 RepID=C4XTI6_SOLM1|nr:PLxRFG domain-containing protein [Solidesulfovibrio magneticus]BAH75983.1 hypothetical protein DMR_24920 [Solidesulfovibrio magneticus RS-1]